MAVFSAAFARFRLQTKQPTAIMPLPDSGVERVRSLNDVARAPPPLTSFTREMLMRWGCCATALVAALISSPPVASADLVSWWRAESNASDSAGSNNGSFAGGTTLGPGYSGQGFVFDGVDDV